MFVKEMILTCYMLGIIAGVSGLTIALLARNKEKSEFNKAIVLFLIGMLAVCAYDMVIYYCDYVIGVLSSTKVIRIGNCIIAVGIYVWIGLQEEIIKREALLILNKLTKRYLLFYIAMWLLLTFFLSEEHFYTLKWLLLVTDIILVISALATSIGHVLFAAAAKEKMSLYYMIIVTAMLMWNYVSYFWGETSVYWGNSRFIREPLDLTIIFWLIINIATLLYEYRYDFSLAFSKTSSELGNRTKADIKTRIEEVCRLYKLTPREKEFVELIYKGKSNKEIAEVLFLSESTVKTHIYNIFRKMDTKNRVGVICIINEEENIENKE